MECTSTHSYADCEGPSGKRLDEPSFDDLPREIRLKCLYHCDWRTRQTAACTNRSTRALVGYLVREPYWHTHVEAQPVVLSAEFTSDAERDRVCRSWARSMVSKLTEIGQPDLCLLFISPKSPPHLEAMLDALRPELPSCTLLAGMVTPGVLGVDPPRDVAEEVEGEICGLVMSMLHLPLGSEVHALHLAGAIDENFEEPDPEWQPPLGRWPSRRSKHPRAWLVFSDKHTHISRVVDGLLRRYPQDMVVGGMGGGSDGLPSLILGGLRDTLGAARVSTGTLCFALSGPGVQALPVVARGMRRISQRYVVSQASLNVVLPPVGSVTLVQQLKHCTTLLAGARGKRTAVGVGPEFTPTSALIQSLQVQGAAVPPRAPLFFGLVPDEKPQLDLPGSAVPGSQEAAPGRMHGPPAASTSSSSVDASSSGGGRGGCGLGASTTGPGQSSSATAPAASTEAGLDQAGGSGEEEEGEEEFGRTPERNLGMTMLQMHDPSALMRTSGYVSVQHSVRLGQVVAFHTPSPLLARQQLADRLLDAADELYGSDRDDEPERPSAPGPADLMRIFSAQPLPVQGVLLFPCVAKGAQFYQEDTVEAGMVQELLPQATLVGCFCNGELGPVPPDELAPTDPGTPHLLGYATVMCLLKLTPTPPPGEELTH